MMKKLFISSVCSIAFILISILCVFNDALHKTAHTPCFSALSLQQNNDLDNEKDSVIAILLYDEIDKAIQEYYGTPTQFALYDAQITEINQINNEFQYRVTVEVPTFHGAHNPPYGLEILTFTISPIGNKLESYTHKTLPN